LYCIYNTHNTMKYMTVWDEFRARHESFFAVFVYLCENIHRSGITEDRYLPYLIHGVKNRGVEKVLAEVTEEYARAISPDEDREVILAAAAVRALITKEMIQDYVSTLPPLEDDD